MSAQAKQVSAAALRHAFDQSFVHARHAETKALEDLLAIRVCGDPYAVRLLDIASLHVDRKVVRVPTGTPDLVGLVGLRGTMAPVYDLRTLLGYGDGPPPRWTLFVRTPDLVGFAFDAFEAHLRTESSAISAHDDAPSSSQYVRGVVRTVDGIRSLIHVASLKEAIISRASAGEAQRSKDP